MKLYNSLVYSVGAHLDQTRIERVSFTSPTVTTRQFFLTTLWRYSFMRFSSLLCCVSNTSSRSDKVDEIKVVVRAAMIQLYTSLTLLLQSRETQAASNQPYTPQRAQGLFDSFADEDDRDVIGPEGLERLCTEADISLDGAQPLILAWQLKCSEMGKFTRAEWLHGMGLLE